MHIEKCKQLLRETKRRCQGRFRIEVPEKRSASLCGFVPRVKGERPKRAIHPLEFQADLPEKAVPSLIDPHPLFVFGEGITIPIGEDH